MAEVFSIPAYPGAVAYNIQYSDPTSADPNGQNPFGPWTNLGTGSITSVSNIVDTATNTDARLYRVQPIVSINGAQIPLKWYDPFRPDTSLYDAQITGALLPYFRSYIGDYGDWQIASTDISMDTGAGSGLLVPDGKRTLFALADIPDASNAIVLGGTVSIMQNGRTLKQNADFTVDYEAGSVQFATAPAGSDVISIKFRNSAYANNWLNACVRASIDALPQLGVNGYYTSLDNNVVTVPMLIPDDGLKGIIGLIGSRILHRALILQKGRDARAYKVGDFSMDTAPSRVLEGLATASLNDWNELRTATNNYIRTATQPIVRTAYDSFFDMGGAIPTFTFLLGEVNSYLWYI